MCGRAPEEHAKEAVSTISQGLLPAGGTIRRLVTT